jgi:uncharacterized protein YndB with AHSA1/START domain
MRILLLLLAVFLLLPAAMWAVGSLLPVVREGQAETTIDAPPDRVLAVIAAVEDQPRWRSGVAAVERTPEGWVEVTERGERIVFVADEMTEARIRLRFTSDAGYAGSWEAVLTPEGQGTRIVATERAEVPSPLRRLVARLMFDPEAFATTYLRELKSESERPLQ